MDKINPQAKKLNKKIKNNSNVVFDLLSDKGKAIFFPKKGILGQTAEAKGKKINATIGAGVDDDGLPIRLACIEKQINISPQEAFSYAPSFGVLELRQKWKEMLYEKNFSLKGKKFSLPVVTNALTHGLSLAGYMFINENDKIIIPDHFWGNYNLTFVNAYGAKLDTFPIFNKNRFNISGLEEKINSDGDKKIILLNFPNNPTGYSPTIEESKNIVSAIKKSAKKGKKIVVLCDDAYFGLVYEDGIEKESIFAHLADIHENVLSVKIDGPTKEDYVWGFRVGFITYNMKNADKDLYSALESKTTGVIRGNISNSSMLSQSLLLNAYNSENYEKEKEEKFNLLKERYDEVKEVFKDKKYEEFFSALPYNSGYFMCIKLKNKNAEDIRQKLLEKYDTGVIAMGNLLRLAFSSVAKKEIKQLFENIYNACKES